MLLPLCLKTFSIHCSCPALAARRTTATMRTLTPWQSHPPFAARISDQQPSLLLLLRRELQIYLCVVRTELYRTLAGTVLTPATVTPTPIPPITTNSQLSSRCNLDTNSLGSKSPHTNLEYPNWRVFQRHLRRFPWDCLVLAPVYPSCQSQSQAPFLRLHLWVGRSKMERRVQLISDRQLQLQRRLLQTALPMMAQPIQQLTAKCLTSTAIQVSPALIFRTPARAQLIHQISHPV